MNHYWTEIYFDSAERRFVVSLITQTDEQLRAHRPGLRIDSSTAHEYAQAAAIGEAMLKGALKGNYR